MSQGQTQIYLVEERLPLGLALGIWRPYLGQGGDFSPIW